MNVKTFGAVDQRSLEQLERCMAAGDAEFGVLCADHHPGYSQPGWWSAHRTPNSASPAAMQRSSCSRLR